MTIIDGDFSKNPWSYSGADYDTSRKQDRMVRGNRPWDLNPWLSGDPSAYRDPSQLFNPLGQPKEAPPPDKGAPLEDDVVPPAPDTSYPKNPGPIDQAALMQHFPFFFYRNV